MSKIGLNEQIAGLERSICNLRDTIAKLQDMARMKRADPVMVLSRERHLDELQAALKTLRWLQGNEDRIKVALDARASLPPRTDV
jgi:hypothetical protein